MQKTESNDEEMLKRVIVESFFRLFFWEARESKTRWSVRKRTLHHII